jgi:hypothetical protein
MILREDVDTVMAQAVQADVFVAGEKVFVYRSEFHVDDVHGVAHRDRSAYGAGESCCYDLASTSVAFQLRPVCVSNDVSGVLL